MGYPKINADQTLDALKFISQTHRSLHDQRRKYEAQAFLMTLTLFAIVGAARFTGKVSLPSPLPWCHCVPVLVGIWLIAYFSMSYLREIHVANQVNKELAQSAEAQISEILRANGTALDVPSQPEKQGRRSARFVPTLVWQCRMIIAFAAIASYLLICGVNEA